MPTEVIDVLFERMNKLEADIAGMRDLMSREHAALAARVGQIEHELVRIDSEHKHTRWWFAAAGAVVAIGLREFVPILISLAGGG